MSCKIKTYQFAADEKLHCKSQWTFDILKTDQHLILDNLQIKERDSGKGCAGHPQTIEILLKGREINTIDISALMKTDCNMGVSCGQFLADCLEKIKSEY